MLERAQVVVYDSLVNAELLRHAAHAETIFVGKAPTRHAIPQEDINRVLREQAERVDCVVRLKGGDPFVFGRGAEEAAYLASEGIPFEIVPGITAGVGVPEDAGIVGDFGVRDPVLFGARCRPGAAWSAPPCGKLPDNDKRLAVTGRSGGDW